MTVDLISRRLLLDDRIPVEEGLFRLRHADGGATGTIRRLNVRRGEGAAALVRHTGRDTFLFVRQFRYPTWENGDGWLTEIPAGLCDPGETPEQTIARELGEEIGYAPRTLRFIARCYVTPGGSNERVHLFYAEVDEGSRVGQGGGMDDEHEMIEVVARRRAELFADLAEGRIADAKTLIAVQWLRLQER
jgi:GDP-mannose pyrophosphatase NudK